MSYFPGPDGAVHFENDGLIWAPARGERRRVLWSGIRNVVLSDGGATIQSDGTSFVISKSVVWYENVVEDIITRAIRANPRYEGPQPTPKPRELAVPGNHEGQVNYARQAQRFYKDRCPTYYEFMAFLAKNPNRRFDEDSFYECSMSLCSGSPVDEGYSTDLVIGEADRWYRRFEKLVGGGRRSGQELLEALKRVDPSEAPKP